MACGRIPPVAFPRAWRYANAMNGRRLLAISSLIFLRSVACSSNPPSGFAPGTTVPDASTAPPGNFQDPDGGFTPSVEAKLTGTVFTPKGDIPVFGALVYFTAEEPAKLPHDLACDRCVQLKEGTPYTRTDAKGQFALEVGRTGRGFLVVQKGGFRRVRDFNVVAGDQAVPRKLTELPGRRDEPEGDDIPSMVIGINNSDQIDETLKKMGIEVEYTESPKADSNVAQVVTKWQNIFKADVLAKQQIVFLPCTTDGPVLGYATQTENQNAMRQFAAAGGRVYVTDWSYDWLHLTWPGYVSLQKKGTTGPLPPDSSLCEGCFNNDWHATARADDPDLKNWIEQALQTSSFEVKKNYSRILSVNPVETTDTDGKPVTVTPKVWVSALTSPEGDGGTPSYLPTTVSFPYQCGKVMFSSYHTEADPGLSTQANVLFYILLETSVCNDSETGVVVVR